MSSTDPAFKKKKQNEKRHFVSTCLVEYVDMGPVDTQGWLWATQRFYLSVVHHPVLTIPICAFFFFYL